MFFFIYLLTFFFHSFTFFNLHFFCIHLSLFFFTTTTTTIKTKTTTTTITHQSVGGHAHSYACNGSLLAGTHQHYHWPGSCTGECLPHTQGNSRRQWEAAAARVQVASSVQPPQRVCVPPPSGHTSRWGSAHPHLATTHKGGINNWI